MPTVLITGANRGLGLQFARDYLCEGWEVIATCRTPRQAHALGALAHEAGDRLHTMALDVADPGSIAGASRELETRAIDMLINSAGLMGTASETVGRLDYDAWAHILAVNTFGPLRMIEAFLGQIERGTHKRVVTLTSLMGSIGDNTSGGWVAYRTSKAAVNMAIKCAALELATRHITCVLIHPGWVRTDMGGARAPLSAAQSVTAMRTLIAGLTAGDGGKFFNYDGRELPW